MLSLDKMVQKSMRAITMHVHATWPFQHILGLNKTQICFGLTEAETIVVLFSIQGFSI